MPNRKSKLFFLASLLALSITLASASHVPFDGMTLQYDYSYEFENKQYPSANSQSEDEVVFTFTKGDDTYDAEAVGSSSLIETEEYKADRSTPYWVPHDLEVGDSITMGDTEYGVSSLSKTIELDSFGEIEVIELRFSNRSTETTLEAQDGEMDVQNYRLSKRRYYHAKTGVWIRFVEETSYTHTTSGLNMEKTETRTFEISENNINTDGDGLTDVEELLEHATYPDVNDTDNDTLDDGTEVREYGSDPTKEDTDGDGLTDGREAELETSLLSVDTDNDGLNDTRELELGTDPTREDTDGDWVEDSRELEIGTNATKSDTDSDALEDGKELELGTDPTVADTDQDGLNDGREVEIGTSPLEKDTDSDYWDDSLDPVPKNAVLPNAAIILAFIAIGGLGYYRRSTENNTSEE